MPKSESYSEPTGRFPTVETEAQMRADYLYLQNNRLYTIIRSILSENDIPDPKGYIACNLLAFHYGLHFYNHISDFALYPQEADPDVQILYQEGYPTVFVLPFSDTTYINYGNPNFDIEFNFDPIKSFPFIDDPEIEFPAFIVQILAGIEEANHLHLQKTHALHGANSNSETDHKSRDLWIDAKLEKYRSVLWHEYAACTVQHAYISRYLIGDFPVSTAQFEVFYQKVRRLRKKWVTSRINS